MKKILISMIVLIVSALCIMLFWHIPLLLVALILILAYVKHRLLPIKKELILFLVIGLLGATFENIIIYSGAWYYPQVFFIHIPLWLPFVWGISGTSAVTLYEGIIGK